MNKMCLIIYRYSDEALLIKFLSVILIALFLCMIIIIVFIGRKFKKIKYNLNYREELFNSLCLNVSDVFIIYDLIKKSFEYISPNFKKVLGVNSKEFMKDPFILLENVPTDKKEEIKALVTTSVIVNSLKSEIEYCHPLTKNNHWMIIRFYPVFNNNKVIRYIICIIDVTNEMKSRQAHQKAYFDVQKANEAKKEFITHISHEIKTPLNAIIGMTQIASLSLSDNEKTKDYLTKINISSYNLLSLINNILDVSNVDSDKLILMKEPFHLIEVLTIFSSMMNSQAELAKQNFIFILNEIEEDCLLGDCLRLNQILGNCLSNSFKFTPSGGEIKFEVSEIEKHANKALFRFTISDTGKGMSEEFIEHMFNPFEQEDRTIPHNYGGTGLGMSIAKNLLHLMGGNINVVSKVNVGTIITIDIVFEIYKDTMEQTVVKESESGFTQYPSIGRRVLVVEDNEINSEITCSLLKLIKVEAELAMDGNEAIKRFENTETGYYDAILMDLHMPGLNGYETTKAIRNSDHPDAKNIHIIMMSADSLEQNRSSMKFGIDDFITKPINMKELTSLLQNVNFKRETLF